MNRFLKKKGAERLPTPSLDESAPPTSPPQSRPVSPGMRKTSGSRWRRAKKPVPEQKPQLDLATALPSNDDFRTSLLMPNLSARFSMLREQDDPRSLLGKASDDSVLTPHRRSRLNEFGHTNSSYLGDIAEVVSLSGSVRPPFVSSDRQPSFASDEDYGSENDAGSTSIMSRARRGEGNNLFGGRQKIYMIPGAGSASSKSVGRALYDDDVTESAFQQRRKMRQALTAAVTDIPASDHGLSFDTSRDENLPRESDDKPLESEALLSHSASISSFDKKRSTTSTSRSEARSSYTAATSVASQPPTAFPSPAVPPPNQLPAGAVANGLASKRGDTKPRRLYEQGLDQHIYEQQTSALTRLNSIQGKRGPGARPMPGLHSTRSASNLQDRPGQAVYALSNNNHNNTTMTTTTTTTTTPPPQQQQPQSSSSPPPLPTPLAPLASFGSVRLPRTDTATLDQKGRDSPSIDAHDTEVLNQALEPGDRGKATAMGAFAKPQHAFDEEQYLQRQRQLQRSNSNAVGAHDSCSRSGSRARPSLSEQERQRTGSDASNSARSRSQSRQGRAAPTPSTAEPNRRAGAGAGAGGGAAAVLPIHPALLNQDKPLFTDTHRTFFGEISASDSEGEDGEPSQQDGQPGGPDYGYGTQHGRWQPSVLPSVLEHPALRSKRSKASLAEEDEEAAARAPRLPAQPLRKPAADADKIVPRDSPFDSPAVTPVMGLGGMMRHLREPSGQSEFLPDIVPKQDDDDVPQMPDLSSRDAHVAGNAPRNADASSRPVANHLRNALDPDSRLRMSYADSNPWDLDEPTAITSSSSSTVKLDQNISAEERFAAQLNSVTEGRSHEADLSRAPSHEEKRRASDSSQTSEAGCEGDSPWQSEMRKQHARGASTETQQERDAFADELAARRQAIQQNIRSMVDEQRRAASPNRPPNGLKAMLRNKPSREFSNEPPRQPTMPAKAMKMLGANGGPPYQPHGAPTHPAMPRELRGELRGEPRGYNFEQQRPRAHSRPKEPTHPRDGSRPRYPPAMMPPPPPPPPPHVGQPRYVHSEQDLRRPRHGPPNGYMLPNGYMSHPAERHPAERTHPMHPTGRSPPTYRPTNGRSRADSEVTGVRPRMRANNPYEYEIERTPIERSGGADNGPVVRAERSPSLSQHPAVREQTPLAASPAVAQSQFPMATERSASAAGGYFDRSAVQPIQTAFADRPNGTAISPAISSAANSSHRPSPVASPAPFACNMTLPVSSPDTDVSTPSSLPTSLPAPSPQTSNPAAYSPPPIISTTARPLRKKTISKHEISEPTLISLTSNFDTVDLPEGASLRNGMEDFPPPIPPINPKRRGAGAIKQVFGLNRHASDEANGASRAPAKSSVAAHNDAVFRQRSDSSSPRPSGVTGPTSPGPVSARGGMANPRAFAAAGIGAGPASPERERMPMGMTTHHHHQQPVVDGGMF